MVLPASAVVVGPLGTRPAAGIEIAGDDDADRLDPAGHVANGVETALLEDVILLDVPGLAPWRLVAGFFDTQELQPLVVLLETARHRREIVTTAAGQTRRGRRAFLARTTTAATAAPTGAIAAGFAR